MRIAYCATNGPEVFSKQVILAITDLVLKLMGPYTHKGTEKYKGEILLDFHFK